MREEPALIFLHLPKTAGTSLRDFLRAPFDPPTVYDEPPPQPALIRAAIDDLRAHGPRLDAPLPAAFAPRFLTELASLGGDRLRDFRLLMGHFWYGVHELLPLSSTYITMLRDPIDRVLSLYGHRTRVQGLDVSLEQYVRDARDPQVANDQTRRIGGDPSRALESVRVDRSTLELAKARLRERFAVVGVAEEFEGTLRLLRAAFGWAEDSQSAVENVSEWRPTAEEVPDEVVAEIRDLNALDVELHAFARDLMEERLGRTPRSAAVEGDGTAGSVRYPPVAGREAQSDEDWQALTFLHIPKTAGLGLRHVIIREYGPENVCIPEPPEDRTRGGPFWRYLETGAGLPDKDTAGWDPNGARFRELAKISDERLRYQKVFMGHLWFRFHEALPRPVRYFTLLREPIDRVLSVYYHRVHNYGLQLSLDDYVTTARDFQFDNAQVRFLVGRMEDADIRFTECTPEMLERAKSNLMEHFAVVGITERFDESFLLMARTFDWMNLNYELWNVNRRRPRGRGVPKHVRDSIAERNAYDVELYAFAQELFEEQLAKLESPIDDATLRGFRRSNLINRSATLRRIYPVARPFIRSARTLRRRARSVLSRGRPD